MRRKALILVPIVLALAASTAGAGLASPKDSGPATVPSERISEVRDLPGGLLAAVNSVRRSNGLHELRLSKPLTRTALGHSVSMAKHGYFEHTDWDGTAFWQRIKATYRPPKQGSWAVGENLAWASPDLTVSQAIDLWLKSPEHRKNLLNPAWKEIGLGSVHALAAPGVYGGMDVTILTADFGRRSPA
jgi:uncharacterized protein YkwD